MPLTVEYPIMVSIDIPTAITAVLVSVFLTFWRDNLNDYLQKRWEKRRSRFQERKDWIIELRALAEEIEGFAISIQTESRGIEKAILPQVEEIEEDIQNIDYREIRTLDDIASKISKHEYVQAFDIQNSLDTMFEEDFQNLNSRQQKEVVNRVTKELSQQIQKQVQAGYYKALGDRIETELRDFSQRLNKHYASRPAKLNEDTYEAFMRLKTAIVVYSLARSISEDDKEHIREMVDQIFEETEEDLAQLAEERKLRNRLKRTIKTFT